MEKQLWLVICGTGRREGIYAIRAGKYVIGRRPDCQIHLTHRSVSRRHAELIYDHGTLTVRDLGSRNGTFVNSEQVTAVQPLAVGSLLRVGDVLLAVRDQVPQWSQHDEDLETPPPSCRDGHGDGLTALSGLPPERRRVGELISLGWPEKRVAARLHKKLCTVHQHVTTLYRDFRVHSKGEFMLRALGRGAEGE